MTICPEGSGTRQLLKELRDHLAPLDGYRVERQQQLLHALVVKLEDELQSDWQALDTVAHNLLGEDQLRVLAHLVTQQRLEAEKSPERQLP